ncbi:phospho-N-acetylmuramoyl-pentapeptide-transferase [Thermodesulforhabdus norvegica]|uniref:Phospho-N-acetylmuramoyl-pentapeptide-transferase n=1 Tax=Thermodesulforhabdus norvegica TaxID=39841 RepID=A0A1I4UYK3_9BACT|nr:phospho-N-acetylmuramoyl-pentapeptide-transferase [Thermodesulforhabdus norvegica]SFM93955.1 Phospho-N-acetylmuramoyl-pentapeptide-transferase [Thermodesulforhabdus norvegica]
MFYLLGQFLCESSDFFSFCRLVNYITFRAIMAALSATLFVLLCSRPFIMMLHRYRLRDQKRDMGLKSAVDKSGTPTMGGLLILGGVYFSLFLWSNWRNPFMWCVVTAATWFGVLGLLDDLKKIRKRSGDRGLSEKTKLLWQSLFAVGFAYVVTGPFSPMPKPLALALYVPFLKNPLCYLPVLLYTLFIFLFVIFVTNSVNLTDGLDGLAITSSLFVLGVLAVFAYVLGNSIYSSYLQFPYIPGTGELTIVAAAFAGAGLGFLWFNAYPAQIFMGDTGSLAIGGVIATMSILLKQEFLFPIVGGLFVAEALTSQIQDKVGVKLVGRRIFYRAPLHHSLQYRGIAEPKVVVRLSIISGILALIALSTLKVR